MKIYSKKFRTFFYPSKHLVSDIPRRIYRDRVARVNTCSLDVLHYAGNQNIFAVANCVDFYLNTHKVLVDKHRIFYLLRKNYVHILYDVGVGVTNRHILSAKHVRRTKQRGITYLIGYLKRLFFCHNRKALRALDIEVFEKFVKLFSVFCHIYVFRLRTQYSDVLLFEHLRQFDCRLSSKSYDHAVGLFCLDNGHYVFVCQRLEIKSVCSIKVCGYRLGVVVDYYHFITLALQCPNAVYGRIVKLNTLTYTDRSGAEYYYFLLITLLVVDKFSCFVFVVKSRIEIRRHRRKLCRASIDHLIRRVSDIFDFLTAELFDSTVQKSHLLCLEIQLVRKF